MELYLLFAVILFSGILVGLKKEQRFYMIKAVLMVSIETVIGSILFLLIIFLFMNLPIKNIVLSGIDSVFVIVLFVAVIDGIILYWLNRFMIPKLKLNHQIQTLCEYIIQWSLIYITIYQVMFDNLISTLKKNNKSGLSLEHIDITNPSDLVILVLPSLISVWIAIILYKTKVDTL